MTWSVPNATYDTRRRRAPCAHAGLRLVALLLLVVGASAPVAHADTLQPSSEGVRTYVAAIGTPAHPERLRKALEALTPEAPQQALDLLVALGHAGGAAAADGLADLYDYRGADLRLRALEVAQRVGLRSARLLTCIRAARTTHDKGLRRATCAALGHLGDGRDVPFLLDAAARDDPRLRQVAFAALRRLSGEKLPPVASRWEAWWSRQVRRVEKSLPAAFKRVAADPASPASRADRSLLRRHAWTDLPGTERTLEAWLDRGGADLKVVACDLARELLLADLVPKLHVVRRRDGSILAVRKAADAALKRLGALVVEGDS